MGADLRALVEIDDNSPPNEPAFTNHPSMWNLLDDICLTTQKDYRFIAAISGYRREVHDPSPLFPLRGIPPRIDFDGKESRHYATRKAMERTGCDDEASWLMLDEIYASLKHYGLSVDDIGTHTKMVLDTMELIAKYYGRDRVRLVFAVSG